MKTCGQCKQPLSADHSCGQYTVSSHTDTTSWEERFDDKYGSFELCEVVSKKDSDRIKQFISQERQKAREEERRRILVFLDSYKDLMSNYVGGLPIH